jgi:hypothetical protein
MPRMNILNAVEREAFDSPPVFNSFQRKQYFDFPSKLRRFVAGLRSPAYRVGFLSTQRRLGVSPTKVRKVPQDSCQLPGRKGFSASPELPRRDLV